MQLSAWSGVVGGQRPSNTPAGHERNLIGTLAALEKARTPMSPGFSTDGRYWARTSDLSSGDIRLVNCSQVLSDQLRFAQKLRVGLLSERHEVVVAWVGGQAGLSRRVLDQHTVLDQAREEGL